MKQLFMTVFLTILIPLLFLFTEGVANAQKINECHPIDSAMVKVTYTTIQVLDTLHSELDTVLQISKMTLVAGRKGSAFYNEELRIRDETPPAPRPAGPIDYAAVFKAIKSAPYRDMDKVFRDYTVNKTIQHQNHCMDGWELLEDIEKPDWEIQDSTANILGFNCVKAVGYFRGRTWIAWFAPELPLPEDPWKLCGLPGIILRAYDSKHHYSYEATGINTKDLGTVDYFNYRVRTKIRDRRKHLMFRRKAMHTDYSTQVASAMLGKRLGKGVYKDPKNYDFRETDYIHVPMEEYSRQDD